MENTQQRVTIVSKKDLDISYFCGSGPGGQARNKVASGVQIIHRESGAIGRASDSRSQEQNKKSAWQRLLADPRMKFFLAKEVYRVKAQETIEQTIERETQEQFLKLEIKDEYGRWMEVPSSYFETPAAKVMAL